MSDQDQRIVDNWKRPLILGSIIIIIAVIVGIIGIYFYNKAQTDIYDIATILYIFWLYD